MLVKVETVVGTVVVVKEVNEAVAGTVVVVVVVEMCKKEEQNGEAEG